MLLNGLGARSSRGGRKAFKYLVSSGRRRDNAVAVLQLAHSSPGMAVEQITGMCLVFECTVGATTSTSTFLFTSPFLEAKVPPFAKLAILPGLFPCDRQEMALGRGSNALS